MSPGESFHCLTCDGAHNENERGAMQKGTPTSDRIGSYDVLRQLSVMGSVQVHLGREEGPGGFARSVTLKIVPKASGPEAGDTEELIREATACAKLTHPCIVRTRQVFEHDNAVVLVLECVDGISLADLLARRGTDPRPAFSDDAALLIGLSVCDALAHAHAVLDEQHGRATIVHRAVSPSNILIGRDGAVKLDGFGFFVSIGLPAHRPPKTVWLAPGKTMLIPCAGAYEATMNPRPLR
jgi:serine/threonine-protein kinase